MTVAGAWLSVKDQKDTKGDALAKTDQSPEELLEEAWKAYQRAVRRFQDIPGAVMAHREIDVAWNSFTDLRSAIASARLSNPVL